MDMRTLFFFAAIVLFIFVFVGGVIWSIRHERNFRARLAEMAEENGWALQTEAQTRTSGAGFHFTSIDPAQGWRATFRQSRGKRKSSTSFTAPDPVFRGGLVAVTLAQHPGVGSTVSNLAGMFDNAIGAKLLGMMMGESVGRYGGQLQEFSAPEGSNLMVLASTDPALFLDLAALGTILQGWQPRYRGAKTPPLVTISDDGVTLRLSYLPDNPEDMRNLISLGQSVMSALQGAGRG